nr:YbjN domain-containing protein [Candidatus Sigynarchaeota archaeon]
MELEDLRILLTQNLGMEVTVHEKYIMSYWKIDKKIQKQIIFFPDAETRILYISMRFDEKNQDADFLAKLLKENLKLSFVKFCMDKDGNLMALAEVPEASISDECLRTSLYAVFKAAERFYVLLSTKARS